MGSRSDKGPVRFAPMKHFVLKPRHALALNPPVRGASKLRIALPSRSEIEHDSDNKQRDRKMDEHDMLRVLCQENHAGNGFPLVSGPANGVTTSPTT